MSPDNSSQEESDELRLQRWLAVNNPDTPAHDLENIINKGCHGLVRRAAEHPRVPPEALVALCDHTDPEIRAAVVDNHQTPMDLHWKLARDLNDDVRYAVAESYVVHMDVLSSLLEDSNPYISHRARVTLKKRNVQMVMSPEFPEQAPGINHGMDDLNQSGRANTA